MLSLLQQPLILSTHSGIETIASAMENSAFLRSILVPFFIEIKFLTNCVCDESRELADYSLFQCQLYGQDFDWNTIMWQK